MSQQGILLRISLVLMLLSWAALLALLLALAANFLFGSSFDASTFMQVMVGLVLLRLTVMLWLKLSGGSVEPVNRP